MLSSPLVITSLCDPPSQPPTPRFCFGNVGEYCASNAANRLCAAYNTTFPDDTPGVRSFFFIGSLSEHNSAALKATLGSSLPSPLFAGSFVPEFTAENEPVGHFASVPCGWTTFDAEIISESQMKLRKRVYTSQQIRQIHSASFHTGYAVLFYWWEPEPIHNRDMYLSEAGLRYNSTLQRFGLIRYSHSLFPHSTPLTLSSPYAHPRPHRHL